MDGGSRNGAGSTAVIARDPAPPDTPPSELPPQSSDAETTPQRLPLVGRTRTRLFVVVALMLGATGVIAVLGIPEVLRLRIGQRTTAALEQEIEEVRLFLASGEEPSTGSPLRSLEQAFDVYLDRNVPSIEEGFATFVDGEPLRDRLRSFPGNELPEETTQAWAALTRSPVDARAAPTHGTFATPRGEASFAALPATVGDSTGLFVVAILPEAGRREIRDLQTFGTAIMLGVVLIAGGGAWLLTGRVLRPVRELTETARTISASGRTQRARVGGSAEASELATSFNAMLDRLDAAYASQQEFVHAAGHELRAPLTVAIGHLELVADDAEEVADVMPLVLDELARMGRILDDLERLAMAERPDFVMPEAIDATVFADELVAKSSALARRTWVLAPTSDVTFVADRDHLTEAVLNLVDNAVKSTQEGDIVSIGIEVVADDVVITVTDTGAGIAAADFARIFERFERGGDARHRYRGAGLGLSIVQSIAGAHGGRVEVASVLGTGTEMRIRIPFARERHEGGWDASDPDR